MNKVIITLLHKNEQGLVEELFETEDEMICGILHDACEDTFITTKHLEELGFTDPRYVLTVSDMILQYGGELP